MATDGSDEQKKGVRGLKGSTPDDVRPDTVIWLVHGTFAGTPAANGEEKAWWEEDSAWSEELKRQLYALPNGPKAEIRSFQWPDPEVGPGPNLETARRNGGEKLAQLLEAFEDKDPRPYHLIGHSHGGSVIWHALVRSAKRMREDPNNGLRGLRSWTTIGTPFIEFRTAWNELRGPVLALVFALAILVIWLATYWGELPGDFAEFQQIWNHPFPVADRGPSKLWEQATGVFSARTTVLVTVFMLVFFAVRCCVNFFLVRINLLISGWNLFRNLSSLAIAAFGVSAASNFVLGTAGLSERRALLALSVIAVSALAALLMWVSFSIGRLLLLYRRDRQRARHEALAAKEFGRKWLGLSHPDDEAIALMSAALLAAPSLRPQQISDVSRRVPWLETFIRPIFDEATWRTLTQFALGDDREGLTVARVGRAPEALRSYNRVLGLGTEQGISNSADKAVKEMLSRMRARLRIFNDVSGKGDIESLVKEISFNGVIHTSYLLASGKKKPTEQQVFPLMGLLVQWIARLPENAAERLGLEKLPPPATAGELRRTEVKANAGRFARLNGLTVAVWVAFVAAATTATATFVSVAILPYTHATQYRVAERATEADPLLLNMTDSPVAGAYAVQLAALGLLEDEQSIWRLLRPIAQANTNSVVSQRLAFAFGLADKDHLVEAVQKHAVGSRAHHVRRARVITLSALYGKLMGGRPLTEQDRLAAKEAWEDERGSRRLMACGDTDQLAMLAIYIPLRADGARNFADLATELEKETTYRLKNCAHGLQQPIDAPIEQARDLVATLALASAKDVLSWGRVSTARDLLRLASAALHDSGSANFDTQRIADLYVRQEQRAQASCKVGLQMMANRLAGSRDASRQWTEDGVCRRARDRAISHLNSKQCDIHPDTSVSEECLAFFNEGDSLLRGVKALCRSERPLLLDGFKLLATRTEKECTAIGDAAAGAIETAFTLVRLGESHESTARLLDFKNPPIQLSSKLASVVPDSASGKLEIADLEQPFRELVSRISKASPNAGQATAAEATRCQTRPELQMSALGRDVAWIRFLAHADPDRATQAANKMLRGLMAQPDCKVAADTVMLIADGLIASRNPENWRKAAAIIDAALGASSTLEAPVVQNLLIGSNQRQISELLSRRLSVNQLGEKLDAVRAKIDQRLVSEYGEEARSTMIGLLASSHAAAGELHAAREAAVRAGERRQLVSSHCAILQHKLAKQPEVNKRFGFEPGRRWPRPAPTLFDVAAPFTFDRSPPGPLSCEATGNYDID